MAACTLETTNINDDKSTSSPLYLPENIVFDMLLRLPVQSLLRFRSVCKSWQNLITTSYFSSAHLNRSLQDQRNVKVICMDQKIDSSLPQDGDFRRIKLLFPSVEVLKCQFSRFTPCGTRPKSILGSCNGILCLGLGRHDLIGLLNPVTREYKELPPPIEKRKQSPTERKLNSFGFGYDAISHDYVVIRIMSFVSNYGIPLYETQVQRYSLNTNSWEELQTISYVVNPYGLDNDKYNSRSGVFVNGALHWIANDLGNQHEFLITFDIATTRFSETQPPPAGEFAWWCARGLGVTVLNGKLCCVRYDTKGIKVWSTEDCLTTEDPWSLMFCIDFNGHDICNCLPIRIIEGKNVLLSDGCRNLILYNLVNKCGRHIDVGDDKGHWETVFVESLVALDSDSQAQKFEAQWGLFDDYMLNFDDDNGMFVLI